ncbi:Type-2 restriction enzyme BsuMI component YdjA [Macrococcoides canis]|uniref:Type-2 restriction enzyme BsuMI component YdjA n=1 Tax=Macrococcoides canis TaxID=1855823 RepID=A0A1W7ADN5_9STAP|nr:LlaJI family restriction endonuclease [Macrococcus canis]ARQ07536.1 Type-2 restriction enzyme BsuMI component YdjA [Macrococcus canis]
MKIKIIKELKPYSVSELTNIFGNNDYIEDILKSLSLMNIVRQINKDSSIIELEELFDIDNLTQINEMKESVYVFKFVGLIYIDDICLLSYPKYISNIEVDKKNNYEMFKVIISVIRKYNSKTQMAGYGQEEINNFNYIATSLEILEDYFESGLYRSEKEIINLNAEGEILWDKTINETDAYFLNGVPYYFNTYHKEQINNDNDFFTMLHSSVLKDINTNLNEIFSLLGIESVFIDAEDLDKINIEYLTNKINQEIAQQFITSKQNKLILFKKYINQEEGKNISENISFIGTNNFNLVWEDVCSIVNNNSNKKTLKELGLSFKNGKESMNLSDVISKPKWTSYSKNVTHTAKRTLIPDIITIDDGKIYIYDAKYYKMTLNDEGVKNHPGIGDVTKQYLYELSYKEFADENNLKIVMNAFLMPYEFDEDIKLGTVNLDIFTFLPDTSFNEIEVVLVSAKKYFNIYLNKL